MTEVLGAALAGASGLAPGGGGRNFAALVGGQSLIGLVTLLTGLPAVMTPLAGNLGEASGLP